MQISSIRFCPFFRSSKFIYLFIYLSWFLLFHLMTLIQFLLQQWLLLKAQFISKMIQIHITYKVVIIQVPSHCSCLSTPQRTITILGTVSFFLHWFQRTRLASSMDAFHSLQIPQILYSTPGDNAIQWSFNGFSTPFRRTSLQVWCISILLGRCGLIWSEDSHRAMGLECLSYRRKFSYSG